MPTTNKVFPTQSLTRSNNPPVFDRNTQSYYGSGLARQTTIPLGPVIQRGEDNYVNAFTECTENKPIKKYVNRPNNQRHDIRVPPRHVRSSSYLPAVEAQPQDSTKLPDPGEEITVTITQSNESQEQKVKCKVRISCIDQSQPGKVPEKQDSGNQNGLYRKAMISDFLGKRSSDLKTGDLTIAGDLEGQLIKLLVNTAWSMCFSNRRAACKEDIWLTAGAHNRWVRSDRQDSQWRESPGLRQD